MGWDMLDMQLFLSLFIACDWMDMVVFTFQAWFESSTFMMLLISLPVRPTLSFGSVSFVFSSEILGSLPLFLGLVGWVFSQEVGIGLRLSLMRLVLHALWTLKWSPLQLTHLGFSLGGWSSVSWDLELHVMQQGCLQLDIQWE